MKTNRMLVLIWIQTIWHSDSVPGGLFVKTLFWRKSADGNKKQEQFPSMQIDKYRTFAKEFVIK